MSKCHKCGKKFTEEDMKNASEGDSSPVGDWDWVCYPCEFEMIENGTWNQWKEKMLNKHNGSGKCDH